MQSEDKVRSLLRCKYCRAAAEDLYGHTQSFLVCAKPACSLSLGFAGNWQEKLELWWKLVFGIESVREVDSANTAVSVNLNAECLNVIGSVSSACEI